MRLLSLLLLLLFYSIACLGIGFSIFQLISRFNLLKNKISAWTELATSFILGQGVLASLWLVLAILHVFILPIIIVVLVISCIPGLLFFVKRRTDLLNQFKSILSDLRNEVWTWKVIAFLAIVTFLVWFTTLGRPLSGDASAFYFSLPKIIASSHQLLTLPGYEFFMYVGLQGEMHYAAFMALNSPDAAKMFFWPTILAGAIILLALGRKSGLGRRGQWISLSMLFTSSAIIWLCGDGKTDLFAMAFGLASYYWAMQTTLGENRSVAPWLAGLFGGFALLAKLSYFVVLVPGIFIIFCWKFIIEFNLSQQRKEFFRSVLLNGLIIICAIILSFIPQFIKNGLLLNNIFAPFGTPQTNQIWYLPETIRRIVLMYPLALTYGNFWAQYGNLSPLILIFLPLSLLLPKSKEIIKSPLFAITVSAFISLVLWIALRPSILAPRYILASLLLWILLPAKAAEYVSQHEHKPRFISMGIQLAIIVVLVSSGLYFKPLVYEPEKTFQRLFNQTSECWQEEDQQNKSLCLALNKINQEAQTGERIYLSPYFRYWLRSDIIQCLSTDEESDQIEAANLTAEQYWELIYQDGYNYFVYDETTLGSIDANQHFLDLPAWVHLDNIYEEGKIIVFHIDVSDPPVEINKECQLTNSSTWQPMLLEAAVD